jgi:hypothetical protein
VVPAWRYRNGYPAIQRLSAQPDQSKLCLARELADRSEEYIGDTDFIGFGVGYQWNNWLRFDVTGEHRKTAELKVIGAYSGFNDFCPPVQTGQPSRTSASTSPGTAFRLGRHGECLCRPRHLVVSYHPSSVPVYGAARHTIAGLTDTGFPFGFSALGSPHHECREHDRQLKMDLA